MNATDAVADEWPGKNFFELRNIFVSQLLLMSHFCSSSAVAYHGTGLHNTRSIAEDGFLLSKGKRFRFGQGIYTTPDIAVAELYASEFTANGNTYKVVIQNRVNPKNVKIISGSDTGIGGSYWITEKEKDIRPYGICVKKIK